MAAVQRPAVRVARALRSVSNPVVSLFCLLGVLATAGMAGAQDTATAGDPLVPDSVLDAPGFPSIVRLPGPVPGVVALRLSIPLAEGATEAGAGRLIETLARRRLSGPAERSGARVESGRTPWGLVYTISGPTADLDHLAFLLREATRAPTGQESVVARERRNMRAALHRAEETGGGRIDAALRLEAAPGHAPVDGTRASVPALSAARLRDVWARSHRPEAMTLLVLGDVADPVLLASLGGLGVGAEATPAAGAAGAPRPGPGPGGVQTLRQWYGVAWSTAGPLDPRGAVAAVLLADRLRENPTRDYEAEVRLWETSEHTVLAVVGAAYPARAGALRNRIDRLLETTAGDLPPGLVRDIAQRAYRDLVLQARTPWGRVHLVGRFLDAGLGPGGARAYLDALAEMDESVLDRFLTDLAARPAARAEVRP